MLNAQTDQTCLLNKLKNQFFLGLFISSIFINGPVELPAYAYRLIPSLTGAENLMVMGIFSYLSAMSTEENRTFRFGMFQILMTIVPIIAQSLSPTVNNNVGYTRKFLKLKMFVANFHVFPF